MLRVVDLLNRNKRDAVTRQHRCIGPIAVQKVCRKDANTESDPLPAKKGR
jgi:hypothetical protein